MSVTSVGERLQQAIRTKRPRRPALWSALVPIILAERARGASIRALAQACTEVGYPISHTELGRRLKAIDDGQVLPEDHMSEAQRIADELFGAGGGQNPFRRYMGEEVGCAGCDFVTTVPGSMSLIVLPQAAHPGRWYVHTALCAQKAGYEAAARLLQICEAADAWPVTCDPQGRTLPAWRVREVREGIIATPEEINAAPTTAVPVAPVSQTDELPTRALEQMEALESELREDPVTN